jgi:hypothetical protein
MPLFCPFQQYLMRYIFIESEAEHWQAELRFDDVSSRRFSVRHRHSSDLCSRKKLIYGVCLAHPRNSIFIKYDDTASADNGVEGNQGCFSSGIIFVQINSAVLTAAGKKKAESL